VGLKEVNISHVLGVVVLSGRLFLDKNMSLCVICVLNLVRSVLGKSISFRNVLNYVPFLLF